jgi:hypothetical protein
VAFRLDLAALRPHSADDRRHITSALDQLAAHCLHNLADRSDIASDTSDIDPNGLDIGSDAPDIVIDASDIGIYCSDIVINASDIGIDAPDIVIDA